MKFVHLALVLSGVPLIGKHSSRSITWRYSSTFVYLSSPMHVVRVTLDQFMTSQGSLRSTSSVATVHCCQCLGRASAQDTNAVVLCSQYLHVHAKHAAHQAVLMVSSLVQGLLLQQHTMTCALHLTECTPFVLVSMFR